MSDDTMTTDTTASSDEGLYQLAYVSTQTKDMSTQDLIELLSECRRVNEERSLTGLLLHKADAFFQVLEGPKAALLRTYAGIERDDRHHNVELLLKEDLTERQFPDWRMGFVELDGVDLSLLPGFSDFLQHEDSPRTLLTHLSYTERLALVFRDMF